MSFSAIEINTNFSTGGNYTLLVIVNGTTLDNGTYSTSTLHFFTFPRELRVSVSVKLTSNLGVWTFFSAIHKDPSIPKSNSNRVTNCSQFSIAAGNSKTCSLSASSGGRPSMPPTYLEELHKLDSYPKSNHYIPRLRQ